MEILATILWFIAPFVFGYGFVYGLADTIAARQKGERAWLGTAFTSVCLVLCIAGIGLILSSYMV